MTSLSPIALNVVILPAPDAHPDDTPTRRLLGGLGHNVTRARSPEQAMQILADEAVDLLVVDITNGKENRLLVNRLADLPVASRPHELAIFSDHADDSLTGLRQKISGTHVHVLLKPLHMHGLLKVLRQLETDALPA